METTSIVLPSALTAANSKKLLLNCRSALTKGELYLDGSSLTSMDYSADAFFALLAELSEKTGNRLILAHFSPEI
ncbi:STAS domain-containing protein, partial [bacterium]|nr:STAS domain-containing protein [bacterium]